MHTKRFVISIYLLTYFKLQNRRKRGGRGSCRGGCGQGRGHHRGGEWRSHRRADGGGTAQRSSANGHDPWKQVADTCLNSGGRCAIGAASSLIAGDHQGAVAAVSDGMEPLGRAVGSALGSAAGGAIGSPRAGEIAAGMGSAVGRGVAEILKDSNLGGRRTSTDEY